MPTSKTDANVSNVPKTDVDATPPIIVGITDPAQYNATYRLSMPKAVRDEMDKLEHEPGPDALALYQKNMLNLAISIPIHPALIGIGTMHLAPWVFTLADLEAKRTSVTSPLLGVSIPVPPDLTPAVDPREQVNEFVASDPTGKDPKVGLWRDVAGYQKLGITVAGPRYLPTERGEQMNGRMDPITETKGDGFKYRCVNPGLVAGVDSAVDDLICLFERIG